MLDNSFNAPENLQINLLKANSRHSSYVSSSDHVTNPVNSMMNQPFNEMPNAIPLNSGKSAGNSPGVYIQGLSISAPVIMMPAINYHSAREYNIEKELQNTEEKLSAFQSGVALSNILMTVYVIQLVMYIGAFIWATVNYADQDNSGENLNYIDEAPVFVKYSWIMVFAGINIVIMILGVYGQYCGYRSFRRKQNVGLSMFNCSVLFMAVCEVMVFLNLLDRHAESGVAVVVVAVNILTAIANLYQYKLAGEFTQLLRKRDNIQTSVFQDPQITLKK
jgi:magnesium-transporting ATPase (P-type)